MSINKKLYVDFARMIRTQRHKALLLTPADSQFEAVLLHDRNRTIESFVNGLCEILAADNPQFNKSKFVAACEIDTESK